MGRPRCACHVPASLPLRTLRRFGGRRAVVHNGQRRWGSRGVGRGVVGHRACMSSACRKQTGRRRRGDRSRGALCKQQVVLWHELSPTTTKARVSWARLLGATWEIPSFRPQPSDKQAKEATTACGVYNSASWGPTDSGGSTLLSNTPLTYTFCYRQKGLFCCRYTCVVDNAENAGLPRRLTDVLRQRRLDDLTVCSCCSKAYVLLFLPMKMTLGMLFMYIYCRSYFYYNPMLLL
ncbi:hypothetical protein VTK73DRAFT_7450 [Phialemonium thermophilum]|uniref:Uncharacterized protein n=1 Tax=Phialemonium thermophilum TaxID=223376 RepID=A0ABR3WF03_9PEZI